jgi:hypothetical protein
MFDSHRFSSAADWLLMLIKFIAASYGVIVARFAWLVLVEAVSFDEFMIRAAPTICASISCGATWITVPLGAEFLRLFMPTVKSHILGLWITFLLSFLYPIIWVGQVWVMSLFWIETWSFRFTLCSFCRYVVLGTINRFGNLFAKNLVMSVRLSSPWALWIQRQLSLHIPTAAGVLGRWLYIGFMDGSTSVDFFDRYVGSWKLYVRGVIQYSVADDYLCIVQKGMRRAFGFGR